MSLADIAKIVVTFLASVGTASAIIAGIIKFCANRIAERLSVKYQHELDKQMEQFKTQLDKRNYVSKARFDTEFSLCKELMQGCKKMIDDTYLVYPTFARVVCGKLRV